MTPIEKHEAHEAQRKLHAAILDIACEQDKGNAVDASSVFAHCANWARAVDHSEKNIQRGAWEVLRASFEREHQADPMLRSTVLEWLCIMLPPEYLLRAIRNLRPEGAGSLVHSVCNALSDAFDWGHSPEGAVFWLAVHDHFRYPTEEKNLPEIPHHD